MEDNNCNKGVSCNVCDCVYNEQGCNCNKDKIEVSKGRENNAHFCKSYICKEIDCDCGCLRHNNIEADHDNFYNERTIYNQPYDED